MHHLIQLIHLCPNPILDITDRRQSQLTWSNALSMSIFRRRLGRLSFNLESTTSFAMSRHPKFAYSEWKHASTLKPPPQQLVSAYLPRLWRVICKGSQPNLSVWNLSTLLYPYFLGLEWEKWSFDSSGSVKAEKIIKKCHNLNFGKILGELPKCHGEAIHTKRFVYGEAA